MPWKKIALKIDQLNQKIGKAAALLLVLMVVFTFVITILRYLFNIGFIPLQESVIYLHSLNFFLAGAYALRRNAHVRVDIYYSNVNARRKAWIDLLGTLFLLFPSLLFFLFVSFEYVANSWSYFEGSREAGGIDAVFLLKSLLLVAPFLMLLQGISECIHKSLFLKNYSTAQSTLTATKEEKSR